MSHYSITYDGGLGDIIIRMFEGNGYASLDKLNPEDTVDIHIVSHNPFAKEFWEWHPKKSQIQVKTYPWRHVTEHNQIRLWNNIPQDVYLPYVPDKAIIYPSEEDKKIIKELGNDPFVVISAIAGGSYRNIDSGTLQKITKRILEKGFRVVGVGRSYDRAEEHSLSGEDVYGFDPRIISLVDKLSVPGTVALIEKSLAVVGCHSAVVLMNWFLARKPNMVVFPQDYVVDNFHVYRKDSDNVLHPIEDVFTFGIHYPETKIGMGERLDISLIDEILGVK